MNVHNKLECLSPAGLSILVQCLRTRPGEKRRVEPRSAITNGREPRSCLGRVFNSKLGCIATLGSKCMVCMQQPLLKLKTWPKARPELKFVHGRAPQRFFTQVGSGLTCKHYTML